MCAHALVWYAAQRHHNICVRARTLAINSRVTRLCENACNYVTHKDMASQDAWGGTVYVAILERNALEFNGVCALKCECVERFQPCNNISCTPGRDVPLNGCVACSHMEFIIFEFVTFRNRTYLGIICNRKSKFILPGRWPQHRNGINNL